MHQKGGRAAITIGIITLIVLVFILFSTIYNQIIAQNEGFFYILIFGGILVLVFVLMSLITKLIAISPQGASSIGYTILEILLMVALGFFFLYKRFSLVNSLSPEDSLFFRIASFLNEGTLKGSLDVVTKSLINPTDYAYAILLSIVFGFTSINPGAVVYLNAALILVIAILAAHTAQAVGGRICGFIAFAATLLIPSQAYEIYSYNSVLFFTTTLFLSFDLYVHIYLAEEMGTFKRILLDGMLAISVAVMLATEPASIIFVLLLIIHYLIFSRDSMKAFFITLAVFLIVFILLLLIKSVILGVSLGEVFRYFGLRFRFASDLETGARYDFAEVYKSFQNTISNQNDSITENYIFLFGTDGGGVSPLQASWLQLSSSLFYMFSLVLSISCVIYLFKNKNSKAVPSMLMTIGMLFTAFIKAIPDGDGFYIFELLIILACAGLTYMYENQHPEAFVEEDIWAVEKKEDEEGEEEEELSEEEKEEQLRRARALIFIGEDDDLYEEIKKEEEREKKAGAGKKDKDAKKKGGADKKEVGKASDAEAGEDAETGGEPESEESEKEVEKAGKPGKKADKAEKEDKKADTKAGKTEKENKKADKKAGKTEKEDKKAGKKAAKAEKPSISAKYDDIDDYDDFKDYDDDFMDDDDFDDDVKGKPAKSKFSKLKTDDDDETGKPLDKKESKKDKKKPKSGEPLDNPVTLPKKHVAKSLDFDDESFDESFDDIEDEMDDDFSDEDYDDSWD